jgi:hypothetical protein
MADNIPDKLHFIWVGATIPHRQASTVLSWALKNPDFPVTLWTNADKIRDNAKQLEDVAKLFPSLIGPAASEVKSASARLVLGSRVGAKKYPEIHLRAPTAVGEMGFKVSARYQQELRARNFGGASDILRIAVLNKEGGIYLDTDSDPDAELPTGMTAADGILFGIYGKTGFCNAVIAAPAGHKYLAEIAAAMTGDYDYWETEGLLAKYRRGVKEARAKLMQAKLGGSEPQIRLAKTQLQEQISSGTLLITGPTQISIWLYLHVGGSYTPLGWAREQFKDPAHVPGNHLQQAQVVAAFQNSVVKPVIGQPEVIQKYGFPRDTSGSTPRPHGSSESARRHMTPARQRAPASNPTATGPRVVEPK